MKFLSLKLLFLILSNCLAADNSSRHLPTVKQSNSVGNNKIDADFNDFNQFVDFDFKEYIAELESKRVSIERASQMSIEELERLEHDSEKLLQKAKAENAHCESYIHGANLALAKLLRQSKPSAEQHYANSWKDSKFSAAKFLELIKGSMQEYSEKERREHTKSLADNAIKWHHNTHLFLKEVRGEKSTDSNYHEAQHIAIDFIYLTKVKLIPSDSAVLESCIQIKSVHGVYGIARHILATDQYSTETLQSIQSGTEYIHDDVIYADKVTQLAYAFGEELRLAWSEDEYKDAQFPLNEKGISFDVRSYLDNKDSNGIVKAYEQCISEADEAGLNGKDCSVSLSSLWKVTFHRKNLEVLKNRYYESKNEQDTILHSCIFNPAFILINSKLYLEEFDKKRFMERLRTHDIHSYEDALKRKLELKQMDSELYKRLMLREKCLEYEQHKDDFAHIQGDFDNMRKSHEHDDRIVYHLVIKIVRELKKDPKEQQCRFEFTSKKLVCSSPYFRSILIKIHNNKKASQILVDFCLNAVSELSLPVSITKFFEQMEVNVNTSGYKIWTALCPPFSSYT